MTTLQAVLAAVGAQAAPDPADPANFPARDVQIERTGLVNTLGYGGLAVGGLAVAGAGAALIRSMASGGLTRVSMPVMLGLGAAALLGGAAFGGSKLIGPKTEHALAAGIPNLELAHRVDAKVSGYTKIVECADGTFAILRDSPPSYSGGGGGGSSSGGSSRPSSGGGGYTPSYPSSGGGSTSRGDDSGSSRNSTDNGNPSSDDF
jgi:hypothetical protein